MNLNLVRYSCLLALLVCLCSWGEKAHRKINSSCVEFFQGELQHLKGWSQFMGDHGSDPDFRKKDNKDEFVKHFIDIDDYDDFKNKHRIETDFEKACRKYGTANVVKGGTLPWVTDSTYNELVRNFKTGNWNRAILTATDLGHYVGDGFMPLHITANYDGQMSAQTGIHRRYEEILIDRYINRIQFKVTRCQKIENVHTFIFSYLYANYAYVGLLLQADSRAYEQAGRAYNNIYYENLWDKTSLFTGKLLEEASKTLARLIYTAWLEAGKPKIPEIPV